MPIAIIHTLEIAEEYMEAWKERDIQGIANLLHPEVHLTSPMAHFTGREQYLRMCEKIMSRLIDVEVRATFSSVTQAMVAYDAVFKEPIGVVRTANLMTFDGPLIRWVELFFDAQPFEQPAGRENAWRDAHSRFDITMQ